MLRQLSALVALMLSSGLVSLGHGAVSSLALQQGSRMGFSDFFLSLLVAITYIGFVAGNKLFRWMLPRISYIRTFSVCAAALAAMSLLLPLLPDKTAWVLLRFGHGLFFSTTVVICESWLNSTVDNQYRGKLHATYMTVNFLAFGLSQYILLLGGENPLAPFSVVAIFIVLSLAPICLTRFAEPQLGGAQQNAAPMRIADAYRIAPIAYLAQLGNGIFTGATWLFVRYAEEITGSEDRAATLAALFFGSGFLLQIPVGWLSDRARDRRTVMSAVYGASALLAMGLFFGDTLPSGIMLFFVLGFGTISATGFSLNVAYGQDFAGRERASEYANMLFQPFAFGAIIGAPIAGFLMDNISAAWLFAFICFICAGIATLAFTDRIMPRFVPVRQSAYQVAPAPYAITPSDDLPQYNEYDIGPELPEQAAADADAASDFVGPQPDAHYLDDRDDADDFVGPTLPEEAGDDDDDGDDAAARAHWRR